ncbi:MAG: cbb3-type cytochrome oxidase assembly protein CcoS [Chlorobiaceae bacterium]|jgi:cbb3-type cytochrome oxidase maturation protein|nr:cbb3-type cytochrome oxidase assembly protein CcoS [Chlorobiaceae bacterium]NTW93808.1 cbb3-type cytochrome oxidase assembly protein CcoS [Chlorobiaceae bacterium]
MDSIFYLIIIGFVFGTAAWLLFIWAVRSGQFDDPEAPKYRMLDDDDEQLNQPAADKTRKSAKR